MIDLFLDSGAYSAHTKGKDIDIHEYIKFIKKYEDSLTVYAALDVIGDAEKTLANQKIMEKAGLKPLPCFHFNEDFKYLEYYSQNYDYIALGGMVGKSKKILIPWLDECFGKFICDDEGVAKIKVHGYGLTTVDLMTRYPWYSVDSTSWVMTGRFGAVYVPVWDIKKKEFIYDKTPWKIAVSDKSPKVKSKGEHYFTLSADMRKHVDDYFKLKGFTVDELSQDYKKRDELNIIYFLDFEKNFKPQPFKVKKSKSFF